MAKSDACAIRPEFKGELKMKAQLLANRSVGEGCWWNKELAMRFTALLSLRSTEGLAKNILDFSFSFKKNRDMLTNKASQPKHSRE